MKGLSKDSAQWITIDEESGGQRLDNFLVRVLKGVPKSHVYRILRTGEVRVNSRRAAPAQRVFEGDQIRLPPIRTAKPDPARLGKTLKGPKLNAPTIHEDESLLIVNKPAGVAVHGGSGIAFGVIERLRAERSDLRYLELVHRLDKDTSGILVLAKKRSALRALHEQLRAGQTDKQYLALVKGQWPHAQRAVRLALTKYTLPTGEKHVQVDPEGMPAHTIFHKVRDYGGYTLLRAQLITGKTHQIRVHLSHLGFPIAGDEKYGDFALNKQLARGTLKRMFLHAARFAFVHPSSGESVVLEAPLPQELSDCLDRLAHAASTKPA